MTDVTTRSVTTGSDKSSIVIVQHLAGIPGGVALDCSADASLTSLRAGHLIITKDGKYYPAPVSGATYAALGDKKPAGVLVSDVLVNRGSALAAVMTMGQVRAAVAPYTYPEAVKTALPRIEFL